jgi:hypothetical protein
MTSLEQLAGTARPEPERDQYGRYKIPHPETGKAQAWTRATTFASSIADTYGLDQWRKRMVVHGLAHRADLYAEAASISDPDAAKDKLGKIAEAAIQAAGASAKARLGTALHSFAEQVDAGATVEIPAPWDADIAAYRATMAGFGAQIDPAHIERIVTVPALGVAGTFDRLVTLNGRLYVGDLKTGRDLSYSWHEIAIQLALYAGAATIWDPTSGTHLPMPAVDQERALVMHLPVGTAQCTLYWIDLAAGREAIALCQQVRTWRKRKGLATVIAGPVPARTPATPTTDEPVHVSVAVSEAVDDLTAKTGQWLAGRIAALADKPDAVQAVRLAWPADGTPGSPPWTTEQLAAVEAAVLAGEAAVRAPFPTSRPAEPTPPPASEPEPAPKPVTEVNGKTCAGLAAQCRTLSEAQTATLRRWFIDGEAGGVAWTPAFVVGAPWPLRYYALLNAAHACVTSLWDDDSPDALTRAALAVVLGEDAVQPALRTGALIGALTPDEAKRLASLAVAFGRSDTDVCAQLGALVAA